MYIFFISYNKQKTLLFVKYDTILVLDNIHTGHGTMVSSQSCLLLVNWDNLDQAAGRQATAESESTLGLEKICCKITECILHTSSYSCSYFHLSPQTKTVWLL